MVNLLQFKLLFSICTTDLYFYDPIENHDNYFLTSIIT